MRAWAIFGLIGVIASVGCARGPEPQGSGSESVAKSVLEFGEGGQPIRVFFRARSMRATSDFDLQTEVSVLYADVSLNNEPPGVEDEVFNCDPGGMGVSIFDRCFPGRTYYFLDDRGDTCPPAGATGDIVCSQYQPILAARRRVATVLGSPSSIPIVVELQKISTVYFEDTITKFGLRVDLPSDGGAPTVVPVTVSGPPPFNFSPFGIKVIGGVLQLSDTCVTTPDGWEFCWDIDVEDADCIPGASLPCQATTAACGIQPGHAVCQADGKVGACVADISSAPELCNNSDDNCDGVADVGFVGTPTDCPDLPCAQPLSTCSGGVETPGVCPTTCNLPGTHPTCPGAPGTPTCDGAVFSCVADHYGPDADGDGLPDRWETYGVDWNCDGTLEADFGPIRTAVGSPTPCPATPGATPCPADPNHKDVFVEVDVMNGLSGLSVADVQKFKESFQLAPVTNPDGTPGIHLWLDTVTANADHLGGGTMIPSDGFSVLQGGDRFLFDRAVLFNSCCYEPVPSGCPDPGADSLPGVLPPTPSFRDCRHYNTRARYFADVCCATGTDPVPEECAGQGTGGYDCATQPRGVENSQYRFLYFRYGIEALSGFENPASREDGIVGACNNGIDESADGTADWNGAAGLPPAPECANDRFGRENGAQGLGSCSDGRDGDGVKDRNDPDCTTDPFMRESDGLGGFAEEGSCSDGIDNSAASGADQLKDVDDPECMGLPPGELPGRPWTCFDGSDNNGLNGADGADPGCSGLPQEDGAGAGSCTNGIDDGALAVPPVKTGPGDFADGLTDWDDPDCAALPREDQAGPNSCWDGIDNGDGGDSRDRSGDCYLFATGEDGLGRVACFDGIDNGADRQADSNDPDCWNFGVAPAVYEPARAEDGFPGACADGRDNSVDGTDAADPDCKPLPTENNAGPGSCFDGVDNHGDGTKDATDADCTPGGVYDETLNTEDGVANAVGLPSCADGVDNSPFDGSDPDCTGKGFDYPVEGPGGAPNSCTNGVDDDNNDVADWDDCACVWRPDCLGAPGGPRLPVEDGVGDDVRGAGLRRGSCFDGVDNSSDGIDSIQRECLYFGGVGWHPAGFLDFDHTAVTAMHELGHNLGLGHGGPGKVGGVIAPSAGTNCNPPYVSIMNYSYAGGIRQAYDPARAEDPAAPAGSCGDVLGLSEDADGLPNEFDPQCFVGEDLIDFSPPRYPDPTQPTGFGRKDLSTLGLDEAAPREDIIWDTADRTNTFTFMYPAGGVADRIPFNGYNYLLSEDPANPVPGGNCGNNANDDGDGLADSADPDCIGYDFNQDGSITRGVAVGPVNLNSGPNSQCYNGAFEVLNGPNDWANLAYACFGPGGPAPAAVTPDPPVDLEGIRAQELTTDLELELDPAPEVVVMNGQADLVATISNHGPARAASARVAFTLTPGLEFGDMPAGCTISDSTALCLFGRLMPGYELSFAFAIVPTSNPSGAPRALRAEAIGAGNIESSPEDNTVDEVIIAASDLEVLDLVGPSTSVTLNVGDSVEVDVDADVVSNGPSNPVDASLTFAASTVDGVVVTPGSSLTVPDLDTVPQTVTKAVKIECTKIGVFSVPVTATIASVGAVYDDPVPGNNADSATLTVRCVPCVHATTSLVLADTTMVTSRQILGGTYFELGATQARVNGDVFVKGNAYLRSNAVVDGKLTLQGQLQTQGAYQVTGGTFPFTPVTILPIESHSITTGSQDRSVGLNGTATWTPGSYDDAYVDTGGTATLTAGTYNFRTFELNAGGKLNLDTSAGDIVINAQTVLRFGDQSVVRAVGAGKVRFYTNASANTVRVGTDIQFGATLSAPSGTVHAYSRTNFAGCIAAKTIQFEPNVTLAQPLAGAVCSSATYEAESITRSTGSSIAGGWNLSTNGYVATSHAFLPGPGALWITAKGQQGGGIWPRMRVFVGGVLVDERFVSTTSFTTYQIPIVAPSGTAEIRVTYDNDFNGGFGNDRNLHLDKISVDCTVSSIRYDFESSAMGWTNVTAPGVQAASSTDQAYSGAKSLAFTINGSGAPTVSVVPSVSPPTGSTIAVRVFIPSTAPVAAIAPYVQGANSTWSDGYTTSFTKGAWQTVVFTVPSTVTQPVSRVGVKLFLGGTFNGKVYLDAVGW